MTQEWDLERKRGGNYVGTRKHCNKPFQAQTIISCENWQRSLLSVTGNAEFYIFLTWGSKTRAAAKRVWYTPESHSGLVTRRDQSVCLLVRVRKCEFRKGNRLLLLDLLVSTFFCLRNKKLYLCAYTDKESFRGEGDGEPHMLWSWGEKQCFLQPPLVAFL